MRRFLIEARFANVPKMKWGGLFKNRRTYKNLKSVKAAIRKQKEYRPDLELRYKEVEVDCPHYGK